MAMPMHSGNATKNTTNDAIPSRAQVAASSFSTPN
jgi:hypothetical protein